MKRSNSSSTLFLFAYHYRPLYKQVVYDTLANPNGGIIQFRYRLQWVSDDIWQHPPVEGESAVVCAVIKHENQDIVFIPLRKGKIVSSEKIADTLFIYVELLSEWIDLSKTVDYDAIIKQMVDRPQLISLDNVSLSGKYVSHGNIKNIQFSEDNMCWVKIIETISATIPYSNGIFYKLIEVRDLSNNSQLNIVEFNKLTHGFKLVGGKHYLFAFYVYYGKEPPRDSEKIFLKFYGPKLLNIFNPQINLGFIVDKKNITMNPTGTLVTKAIQVEITLKDKRSNILPNERIEGPQIQIPVNVVKGRKTIVFLLFIIVGLLIVSNAVQDVLLSYNIAKDFINYYKPVFSLIGTAIATIGIFFFDQYKGE